MNARAAAAVGAIQRAPSDLLGAGSPPGERSEEHKKDIENTFQSLKRAGISGNAARRAAQKMVLELNIRKITRLQNLLMRGKFREKPVQTDFTADKLEQRIWSVQKHVAREWVIWIAMGFTVHRCWRESDSCRRRRL